MLETIKCFLFKHHYRGELFPRADLPQDKPVYKKHSFIVFRCVKCGKVKCSGDIN